MYIIGSARISENGTAIGSKAGDQTGKEVAEENFYIHKKGWLGFAPISLEYGRRLAQSMRDACNNPRIGYTQDLKGRLGVFNWTSVGRKIRDIKEDTDCDCSMLGRACIFESTGKDLGNFSTANMPQVLKASKLFKDPIEITDKSQLTLGMILVTKTKGHTAIVTEVDRVPNKLQGIVEAEEVYKAGKDAAYIGKYVVASEEIAIKDGASELRKIIAIAPRGAILECQGFHLNKWLYVNYIHNGTSYRGYALKSKLKKI